ncbi:TetR/AcrR family transcriptional regulator [Motilibacter aurantiacus]|uniref:TetR/AcrR family transcriptional regulator n=1 Tax=Motilibacter aurantiacus TaxID=2714955 RepID=UPI0018C88298|nr:TetR/AcrR family transcriptional regulator [Motilibacter aurantiacus]NHC46702.1 TetR/AcrR family transcriptional regulator [Motilibacter aurantiacus]
MEDTPGRRERKKLATRQAILDAARPLFLERGFDPVTIAEVADAADVSVATVFNHFRTKEDLVFWNQPADERALADAVRAAGPGERVLDAVRRYEEQRVTAKQEPDAMAGYRRFLTVLAGSETLRARERWIEVRRREELQAALAEVLGPGAGEVEVELLAGQLVAAHRAIDTVVRRGILAGDGPARLRGAATAAVEEVFAALEAGAGRHRSAAQGTGGPGTSP